jgi:hypothetical protein
MPWKTLEVLPLSVEVLPLVVVDNSINLCKHLSDWFFGCVAKNRRGQAMACLPSLR